MSGARPSIAVRQRFNGASIAGRGGPKRASVPSIGFLRSNGCVCPDCGVVDRSGALQGKTDRVGSYKCYACRKQFTVKVGTIFEASHIQMRDWLTAIRFLKERLQREPVASDARGHAKNRMVYGASHLRSHAFR
jgi:transposase-like protein